ncbi:MAG: hypothetical protein COA63_008155 [Methylophaga sp.]|nr:hypothetical protein [Methylophaga sp.]
MVFSITKSFFLFFYTFTFLIISSQAIADEICSYDILGIKPSMTIASAKSLLIQQGFHQTSIPSTRDLRVISITFTNEKPWPPEGITLTRTQLAIATHMQDPKSKQAYEKQAETNPSMRKILTEIANLHLPPKENSMSVSIAAPNGKAISTPRISTVTANYKFPLEVSAGRDLVYSQAHKSLNNAVWDKFCANINVSELNNWRFSDKSEILNRTCYHDPYITPRLGEHFRITIAPLIRGDKRGCNYSYTSGARAAKEIFSR